MSMLAERRRKQKWSLNPRGKDWSEDSNKFGQKLLEKMGWKHGKGLGAHENGILEHVKVSYKNDSKGMGFMEQSEQWTEHQDNYSKLLENLKTENTSCDNSSPTICSLEEKSLKSRARVHYHKFTRGKDLSRYSAKDLANILGKKSFEKPVKIEEEQLAEDSHDSKKSFGVETIKGGSMHDYFKKKLPNFSMSNGYKIGSNGVLKAEEHSDSDVERPSFGFGSNLTVKKENSDSETERPSFGFGYNNHIEIANGSPLEGDHPKLKKRKKNDAQNTFISFINGTSSTDNEVVESKQKKKKRKSKVSDDEVREKKMSFVSYLQEESEFTTMTESSVLESSCSKKAAKKRKDRPEVEEAAENVEPKKRKLEAQPERAELKAKKSKKKQTNLDGGIANPAFDPMSNNIYVEKHVLQPINEMEVDEVEETNNETLVVDDVKSGKSKKRRKKAELNGFVNPEFSPEIELDDTFVNVEENPYEVKVKKPKRKKRKEQEQEENFYALDNPNFDLDAPAQAEELNGDLEVTRKEKKKKSKKLKRELEEKEEPVKSTPQDQAEELNCDIMLNVAAIPVAAATPKANSTRNESKTKVKRRKSVRFSDVHEERIIPNKDDLQEMENKRELYDINTMIIESGLEEQAKKDGKEGLVNIGFDLRSIDKISFYEKTSKKGRGIENAGFNEDAVKLEENMVGIKRKLENCQAEIENDINEAKDLGEESELPVGMVASNKDQHEQTAEGVLLAFKTAKFGRSPNYHRAETGAKKSYKHLIKGDVVLKFQNCNLHAIDGYGNFKKKRNKALI